MSVHKISPIEGPLADLLTKTTTAKCRSRYINIDGFILPEYYAELADEIDNFKIRDDDIWVIGSPKTGTTWTQEMVWSIANELDFEGGKLSIDERFPLLEFSALFNREAAEEAVSGEIIPPDYLVKSIKYCESRPTPRFIKTHLPLELIPRDLRTRAKKPKIVYICRDPKDTCISLYHFAKFLIGFSGSFEEFCNLFLGDTLAWTPYWKSVLGYWNKRHEYDNLLFLKYEEMKMDLPAVIKKTAKFLGKNLTNDQISSLSEHLSFSKMRLNPAVNHGDLVSESQKVQEIEAEGQFMRCGKTGQWKTVMTPELIKRFDERTHEYFDSTGLSF